MTDYIHYSATCPVNPWDCHPPNPVHGKPSGLWLSVGDAWDRWKEAEDFGAPLPGWRCDTSGARILEVKGADIIPIMQADHERQRVAKPYNTGAIHYPDWLHFMTEGWDGFALVDYGEWSKYEIIAKLPQIPNWYWLWDVPSACVWNASKLRFHPEPIPPRPWVPREE